MHGRFEVFGCDGFENHGLRKNSRVRPFMFSLVPRSQGNRGNEEVYAELFCYPFMQNELPAGIGRDRLTICQKIVGGKS